MPTGDPQFLVSVVVGETEMGFIRFVPRQPVPALTVGLDGNWRIAAPGVISAHLSLMFDGQKLYVAALSPNEPVYINGTPIDGRWWMLSAPAELRFGHACMRVTLETPSSPAPRPARQGASAPPDAEQAGAGVTALGGAARWELQQRDEPQPGGKRTQLYDPTALPQRPGRSQPPTPVGRGPDPVARPAPAAVAPHAAPGVPDRSPSVLPPSAGEPPMASTMRRPLLAGQPPDVRPAAGGSSPPAKQGAAPPERPVSPLPPLGPAGQAPTIVADASAWVNRAPKANVPPANIPANVVRTPAPPPWAANQVNPQPNATAGDSLPAGVPKVKLGGGLVDAWRSTSLVKKITFFLLPLAIVAVLLPEPKPAPGPDASARAVPSSSGSASGTARTASSAASGTARTASSAASGAMPSAAHAGLEARAGTSASASAIADSKPREVSPTAPADSASSEPGATRAAPADGSERAAINAAFEGRWPLAVRLYDGLAESHPDQPAFREAARILRETKTHTK